MLQILCFKLLKRHFLIAPQKQKDRPDNNDITSETPYISTLWLKLLTRTMFFWLYLDQTKTFNYDANINPGKEKSKLILRS